jgi:hypothetical protein
MVRQLIERRNVDYRLSFSSVQKHSVSSKQMKHKLFIGLILLEIAVIAILLVSGQIGIQARQPQRAAKRTIVNRLMLTDFALWTEARYTRNPSQADLFTPFQDFPSAIEHFPAGSILAPGKIRDATRLEFKKQAPPVRSQ